MRTGHSFHVPHRLGWLVGAAVLCATLLALGLVRAQPGPPAQAGVVIQFGDGRVTKACVALGDDGQATGEEALLAAGLPVIVEAGGAGAAVCKVDGEGCDYPATGCFCQCSLGAGTACRYWSYSRLVNGQWQLSNIGASSTLVRAGDVEGWAWGDGTVNSGARPPQMSYNEVCPAGAIATATATIAPPVAEPSATATQGPPAVYVPLVGQPDTSSPPANATPPSATATVATPPPPTASRTPAVAAATPLATAAASPSSTRAPATTTAGSTPSPTDAVAPAAPSREATVSVDITELVAATALPTAPTSAAPSAILAAAAPSPEQAAAAAQEGPATPTAPNGPAQASTPTLTASTAAPPTLAPPPVSSPLPSSQQRSAEARTPDAPPASYLALGLLALGLIVGLGVLQLRRR